MKQVITHRPYLYYGIITVLIGSNFLFWGLAGINVAQAGKIPQGVTANGQNIGGLTKEQAVQRLAPIHSNLQKKPITITVAQKDYATTLNDLGYTIDTQAMANEALALGKSQDTSTRLRSYLLPTQLKPLEMRFTTNPDKLTAFIAKIQEELPSPKDISLDYQNNEIKIIPAETGVTLDSDLAKKNIETQLHKSIDTLTTISLLTNTVNPPLSQESQVRKSQEFVQKLIAKPLVLQIEDTKIEIPPKDLYTFVIYSTQNNELVSTIDESKVKAKAQEIAKKVTINPEAKKVSITDNSVITEGRDGRKLNADETASLILQRVKAADTETPLVLTAEKVDRKTETIGPEYTLGRDSGKYIEVDLSLQRLNLIEGSTHVQGFSVSTGKWSTPTPLGEFTIHNHVRTAWSARYKLYMDWWMAITPDGLYGIHQLPRWPSGLIEGESHIGTPVSHGCIRLGKSDAETVYNWATNGTKVYIHE